jgi:hypothetical protein
MRLTYDELLSNQLALAIVRSRNKQGHAQQGNGACAAASSASALHLDQVPGKRSRDHRRHGRADAHAAPAAGRRRQRTVVALLAMATR